MAKIPSFNIIPESKEKEPIWVSAVFWLLFGTLILSVIMVFVSRSQVNDFIKKNAALRQEAEQLIANNKGFNQDATLMFQRLNDFSQLLKEHRFNSNLFIFLGTICHPRAQFTSFAISETANHLTLGMKTENFKTLDEQLLILRSSPQVSNPKFSELNINKDGKIVCMLDFDYDKKIVSFFEGI